MTYCIDLASIEFDSLLLYLLTMRLIHWDLNTKDW